MAIAARKHSHSPYSRYAVGAALQSGRKIFTGCNVENASYGGAICAERTAVLKAVSEGQKSFQTLVVVVNSPKRIVPCGFCLQTLAEFCGPSLEIWVGTPKKLTGHYTFSEVLPFPFSPKELT